MLCRFETGPETKFVNPELVRVLTIDSNNVNYTLIHFDQHHRLAVNMPISQVADVLDDGLRR